MAQLFIRKTVRKIGTEGSSGNESAAKPQNPAHMDLAAMRRITENAGETRGRDLSNQRYSLSQMLRVSEQERNQRNQKASRTYA
jgi:hypothetical protein